jgi:hypothetical protein
MNDSAAESALEDQLADPDLDRRIAALRSLAAAIPLPARKGTNTHVHTNHSFSAFRSPSEAAWCAAKAGVEVFGINDHFTVAGHDEFRRACGVLGFPRPSRSKRSPWTVRPKPTVCCSTIREIPAASTCVARA